MRQNITNLLLYNALRFIFPKPIFLALMLLSFLTGLRYSDIQALRWKQIQQTSKGTWQALVVQQKTKRPDYKPVTAQALQLCDERPDDDERLVFEGLTDVSWISIPLKAWIEASGIKKHVTFHTRRHIKSSYSLKTRNLQRCRLDR